MQVPKNQGRAPSSPIPSEQDLYMALAIMHEKGRVKTPTFDERFRGQDPASLPIDVQQRGGPVVGQPKGGYGSQPSLIPLDEAQVRPSVGLMGGSR